PVALPAELHRYPAVEIWQGYLSARGGPVTVRLRRYGAETILTLKAGMRGLAQTEVEVPLAPDQFEALWPHTRGQRVHKTRHRIPLAEGWTADVDVYHGALADHVVAEVEFDSEPQARAFRPPDWLGPEVTTDVRYRAHALAVQGWPTEA
ncbi:MAG: adenylate cyclase, partial [Bacteroidota bacterium]